MTTESNSNKQYPIPGNNRDNPEKNPSEKCNESQTPAFNKAEALLTSIKAEPEMASEDFKNRLKSEILAKRQGANSMKDYFNRLGEWFRLALKPKYLAPLVASVTILALVLGAINFLPLYRGSRLAGPAGVDDFFASFSRLVISPAHAQDNFTLEPQAADSLGVEADTIFILKSKEPVATTLIKENLRLEPAVEFELEAVSDIEWRIIPAEPLPPSTILKASLAASYADENGLSQVREFGWAYQVKDNFKVLNALPKHAAVNVPTNTGIEITFSHENFQDFEKNFSIEPQVAGSFEKHSRTLVFVPKDQLTPGQVYTVKIGQGLGLTGSTETLGEDYVFSFETVATGSADYSSWLYLHNKLMETNSKDRPLIQISSNQVNTNLKTAVYAFPSEAAFADSLSRWDALPWWANSRAGFKIDTAPLRLLEESELPIRSEGYARFIELPHALDRGFYLLELKYLDQTYQLWLQVSDLVVYYNLTKTDSLFWVNSAATGQPVAGAKIELPASSLSHATNAEGVAVFPTPAAVKAGFDDPETYDRQYFRIATGDDVVLAPASSLYRDWWYQTDTVQDDYWRYFYTDRPFYKPTDTVKYWGFLKKRDGAGVSDPVTVTLQKQGYFDYHYRPAIVATADAVLNAGNTFTGEFKLDNLQPGGYTIEIKVGEDVVYRKYLSIETYVKPAYSITLTPEKKAAYAGDLVSLKGEVQFFDGTPVPGLELKFHTPDGGTTHITDDKGEVDLAYTKKYHNCAEPWGCWPESAYLTLFPAQSELSEIQGRTSLNFFGPNVYLTEQIAYPAAGQAVLTLTSKKIDLNQVETAEWWGNKLGEEPAPGTEIEISATRITHTKTERGTAYDFINKRSYKIYNYVENRQDAGTIKAVTDTDGNYDYERRIEPESSYEISVKITDKNGRNELKRYMLYYHDGASLRRYGSSDFNYYHFELPDKKYKVGDEVAAKFLRNEDALPAGASKYLYLKLKNGLKSYDVADSPEFKFDFAAADIPNVNIMGVYFTGDSYITPASGYYTYSVNYDQSGKELKFELKTDKTSYRPGEEVALEVAVTGPDGAPVAAEVNLNLVDEAFYAIADDTATPLETLYAYVQSGSLLNRNTHANIKDQMGGAEKGGCFAAGTLIRLADGKEKPIEEIKRGDRVATIGNPVSFKEESGAVSEVWTHTVNELLVINGRLHVTPAHLIYANHRFTEAGRLEKGDWLLLADGTEEIVEKIEYRHGLFPVYNFRVEPQHTYFADGYYVHNEKGGGPREFFVDAALFLAVTTGADGRAETRFKLPDNVTSWRLTAQAISSDLEAGAATVKIPVSLPVFVDVGLGADYLAADKPAAKLRAFGTALKQNDAVAFEVTAKSLGNGATSTLSGQAFKPVSYDLPPLTPGKHDLVYGVKAGGFEDAVKLPIDVKLSRLTADTLKQETLTTATTLDLPDGYSADVRIAGRKQSELYRALHNLTNYWNDRLDFVLASDLAQELLTEIFAENKWPARLDAGNYQDANGGISLLPYSSPDFELSAETALAGAPGFDRLSLNRYFYDLLENRQSSREEISVALAGLAALSEPVLPRLDLWLKRDDLSVKEKLYLARGLAALGAEEQARPVFYSLLAAHGETKASHIALRVSDNLEEVFQATALGAALGAALNAPEADGLYQFLVANQDLYGEDKNSEKIYNLEKFGYVQNSLRYLNMEPIKITYEFAGKTEEKEIKRGESLNLIVMPSLASTLKFQAVSGDAAITIRTATAFDPRTAAVTSDLSLRRAYFVNGRETTTFKETDIIEVRLYPRFAANALEASYQITDFLPSGLIPATKLHFRGGSYSCNTWYPYRIEGQAVKYMIGKGWNANNCGGDYFRYFARPKTLGEYAAEPAMIQAYSNPEYQNYSDGGRIMITK